MTGAALRRAAFAAKTGLLMRADRRALRDMLAAEREDPRRAEARAAAASAAIASHAFQSSPFYRDHYSAAGFTAADVARPENFAALPPLTKEHIAEHRDRIASTASPESDRLPVRTGGSTGHPLLLANDRAAPTAALWWRVYDWWGVHPADHSAMIYRQVRTGRAGVAARLEWWPTQQIVLDARGATDEDTEAFLAHFRRLRPDLLVGYVEAVYAFARYVQRTGADLPSPTAISVTASVLHPGQRAHIEEVLGAPVYDTYRSAEVPWIAAECGARDGLHVLSDRRRVDIVDADGSPSAEGTTGSVLVTDFDNRAFPIIRYQIGDRTRVVPGACACGRSLRRIGAIEGRIADALHSPTGRTVTGGLGGLFSPWPGSVRQFQVHQRDDYSIHLRYVPGADRERADQAGVGAAQALAVMLHGEVPVAPVAVERIEDIGGKARLVVSDVGGD